MLVATLLGLLLVAPSAAAAPASRPLVVLGAPGLRWSELSPTATPHLWSLVGESAIGSLVTRTARPVTCAPDGWLSLGTGVRAQAVAHEGRPGSKERCPTTTVAVSGGRVEDWASLTSFSRHSDYGATPGLLGDALARRGCALAVGPGAALALALADGAVPDYRADPSQLTADDVRRCPVTLVDLAAAGTTPADLDRAAGAALGAAGDTDVLLVSVSGDPTTTTPHLGVAALRAPGSAGHWLTSRSTRRPTLSQLTDATVTVLRHAGAAEPEELVGTPQRPGAARPAAAAAVAHLVQADDDEQSARRAQAGFWTVLLVLQFLLYVAVAVALGRAWGGERTRSTALRAARVGGLLFGGVPAATFLADLLPWERSSVPALAVLGLVVVLAALVALLAEAGPWRRRPLGPLAAVGAVTALVLGVDVLTGGHLQEGTLMGYFPTVAGRFYGFGNQAFSLFATGGLLAATGLAAALRTPRARALTVALVGLVVLVLDGAPPLGADVGGVLAVIPGFAVLVLLVAGLRLSWVRLVAACGAAVVALAALAALDASRPADSRTHLGRFAVELVHGEGGRTLRRKAGANLSLLLSTPLTLLLPAALLFVVLVLRRPARWHAPALERAYDREPLLRAVLLALLVLQVVAFAVNDSGVAIPAVALTMVIPLLVAASASALQLDAAAGPAPAPTPPTAPRPGAAPA
ncbi:hypothetical protein EV189_0537 [Motilibacter rhizosphaerae]|uniref:Uncharacterized protein n=1 Tax=Motilibacter rhizosphaerae TaxID=598652 RepID=A0A4Q7NWB5_9ACTN|nr:hypothetical protein EV189_0537 [Motilibacter rhizosphaerae]